MDHILFIYSCTDGHLGCFHFLTIVYKPALNMDVQILLRDIAFSSSELIMAFKVVGSTGGEVKNLLANSDAREVGSIPESRRSPGIGNDNLL